MATNQSLEFTGRVLFLHGYTQNAGLFHSKTLALRKKLISMKLKPVYLNAPLLIEQSQLDAAEEILKITNLTGSKEEHNYRSWAERRPDLKYTFGHAKETVSDYIKNGTIIVGTTEDEAANLILDKETDLKLPIVGLVGFSQGAAFSAAMVDKFEELYGVPPLQWAILYSGYMFDIRAMPEHAYLFSKDRGISSKSTRLLHVLGELDTVVSEERSMQLFDYVPEVSTMLKHPGGHFVPNSRPFVEKVANWIVAKEEPPKKEERKDEKSDLDSLLDMMKGFGG